VTSLNFLSGVSTLSNKHLPQILVLITVVGILSNCAYFNTFYNARSYFEQAEKKRIERGGETAAKQITDLYQKVIEKSQKIITKFPQSRYVQESYYLIGQSHYHRQELNDAQANFRILLDDKDLTYHFAANYWLAMCKWKTGKIQPAIDDLTKLSISPEKENFEVLIYLALADIYIELNDRENSLNALEKAAESAKTRTEKGLIHFRLAELAFKHNQYQRAIDSYNITIKYSNVVHQIHTAHLNVIKSYRFLDDNDAATRKIRNLLVNDSFQKIHDELELELAKIYLRNDQLETTILRFETIVKDFPKTLVSAEAYLLLGNIYLRKLNDYQKALQNYRYVQRESSASTFAQTSRIRIRELEAYFASKKVVEDFNSIQVADSVDNSKAFSLPANMTEEQFVEAISKNYYTLGELDGFHFENLENSIESFKNIELYQHEDYYPKSLYALNSIYHQMGDSSLAMEANKTLQEEFGDTEYAMALRARYRSTMDSTDYFRDRTLYNAELSAANGFEDNLQQYRTILISENTSETISSAAYFLAYYFDEIASDPDSALKYYSFLNENYPDSEQAKESNPRYKSILNLISGEKQ
jgi:tetratricopeptide (TPR) repeat protein